MKTLFKSLRSIDKMQSCIDKLHEQVHTVEFHLRELNNYAECLEKRIEALEEKYNGLDEAIEYGGNIFNQYGARLQDIEMHIFPLEPLKPRRADTYANIEQKEPDHWERED